ILASETGVVPCEAHEIVEKGRLGPGEMIAVDLAHGVLLRDNEIKTALARREPYQQWVEQHLVRLATIPGTSMSPTTTPATPTTLDTHTLFDRQRLFGYTHEDVEFILRPMLTEKKEPVWSMGDDTPVAAISQHVRSFSDYFHQRFAQVTNPPIDPLRESMVLSLDCYLGRRQSLLTETALHARLLHLESPLLTETQLETVRNLKKGEFRSRTLNATFESAGGETALEKALLQLETEAIAAVTDGVTLLILSDKQANLAQLPIPMLIVLGFIHQSLIQHGLRTYTSLICETGAACDIHQIALLLGYGAETVVPYLALESIRALAGERKLEHLTQEEAVELYLHVIEDGLCKVMARMGISTVRNIIGAGQFEVVGLESRLIEHCFTGSAARPGNVTLAMIARQVLERSHAIQKSVEEEQQAAAHNTRRRKLNDTGTYRFRRDAEYHAFNPLLVRALQKAAQSGTREDYTAYTTMVYQRPPTALRDLLSFVQTTPIPIEQVEPMESIRARFVVSAMSIGALSPETHRTIAAAMNSIGCRNNTGEGGEDPDWYSETLEGYPVSSKIKQVASARFGVTAEYLVRAEELEIKMAQGSKPGEGGQLPPMKVTPFIARLRHTAQGVALISPPPHHDIYSIEDLAQLIYDLRQVNPQARIGVKLVSSIGVGTIAAGVAKAHANYVLISGHDGGTGASPMQSIKHAGIPWEFGLAETQQVLLKNGLRGRVKVRVDGGFKTGRDVVIGAMLGAEEFGFGTAALVTLGCDMARQCHLNTCPAGIATQREDLRAKFTGKAQYLINYFTLLAEEVREWLAQLGIARLDDLIGRADMLECMDNSSFNLKPLLVAAVGKSTDTQQTQLRTSLLPEQLLEEAEEALSGERSVLIQHPIHNYDRAIGAYLAGEIARRYGNTGLPGVSITCAFHGSAGQSFGAFCVPGMRLLLNGDANDYVGKSMTGGQIVIAPPADASFAAYKNTILGNTVLYGATGGQLFAAGRAGERFAVRNSGALAVVEGTGAHACEYMTGGMVVVLGETGQNFGAGMSAGVAYVLDTTGTFPMRCNTELVELQRLDDPDEIEALRTIIQMHHKKTRSWRASQLLAEWNRMQRLFWRVSPYNSTHSARDYVDHYEKEVAMVGASF
ncbi:MAG TPA: glutamate synthase large subunit, partial [Ktedonobacteraceae bacterium]|nr:glutamate synthase large subunit [Ktedonobacteraceae bacterium]